ncbi:MAG: porin family protein [Ginsengibacter sp.]
MKTKLIPFAILLFMSSSLLAQKFSFGVKAGANLSKISGKSFKDEFAFGYHAGVFASIGGDKFYVQPEVIFNQVNTDTATSFSQVYQFNKINSIQLQYLSVPVLLGYKLNKIISLQAGPQFGIILDQNKDLLQNGKDAFKSGNFSVVGGVQLNLLKLRVYGRYVGGITNIDNVGNNDSWKLNSFQIGVGFAF